MYHKYPLLVVTARVTLVGSLEHDNHDNMNCSGTLLAKFTSCVIDPNVINLWCQAGLLRQHIVVLILLLMSSLENRSGSLCRGERTSFSNSSSVDFARSDCHSLVDCAISSPSRFIVLFFVLLKKVDE